MNTNTARIEPDEPSRDHTATYSPEDDKLRIYPAYRLPADEYASLKAAGYGWAPKQECFYAVWTPHREETVLEFADESGTGVNTVLLTISKPATNKESLTVQKPNIIKSVLFQLTLF